MKIRLLQSPIRYNPNDGGSVLVFKEPEGKIKSIETNSKIGNYLINNGYAEMYKANKKDDKKIELVDDIDTKTQEVDKKES